MSFTAMSAFRLQVQTGFNLRVRGDICTCAQDKTCVPASALHQILPPHPKKEKNNKLCYKFISALWELRSSDSSWAAAMFHFTFVQLLYSSAGDNWTSIHKSDSFHIYLLKGCTDIDLQRDWTLWHSKFISLGQGALEATLAVKQLSSS